MSYIKEFQDLPEVNFTGGLTLDKIQGTMEEKYGEAMTAAGKSGVLSAASPYKLLIMGASAIGYQIVQLLDQKGKANFLRYAQGAALDNLASFKKIVREPAKKAKATVRFAMTSIRTSATAIPAGTRVSTEDNIYFEVASYSEIPVGSLYADVKVQAIDAGENGNGIAAGLINKIVDPLPYIESVTSTTASAGGADIESDADLTYRVYMAPAGYSVAGPKDAYEYFAKSFRADVADVEVYSPAPCKVTVRFLLDGGVIPDQKTRNEMLAYLSGETRRPLADEVTVEVPEEVGYNITLTYWIAESKSGAAVSIQSAVNAAIAEYQVWQRAMGRDINPTELTARIRNAGAKRVSVTAPVFTAVEEGKLPKAGTVTVTYGGLEDD
nr:MAG TPA: baseplate assembly protein [Caudoviricetes sp.]